MCSVLTITTYHTRCGRCCNDTRSDHFPCEVAVQTGTGCANPRHQATGTSSYVGYCPLHRDEGSEEE